MDDELIKVIRLAVANYQGCGYCDGNCGECQSEAKAIADAIEAQFGSLRVEYSAYENSAVGISEQGKEMIESRNINSIWYRRLVSGWKKE